MQTAATALSSPGAATMFNLTPMLSGRIDDLLRGAGVQRSAARAIRRGKDLITEGTRSVSPLLLLEGFAIRYRILRDGQRQVLNILLPGDFAGVPSCFFEAALYSIRTVTPALVLPVPTASLVNLLETQPQVAEKLFWDFAREAAIYANRLVTISRHSATERVAHFLLELFTRMERIGLTDNNAFSLPLTQSILSDAVGLSIPYVNRVLHQLHEDGLVGIKDQVITIENFDGISTLADFEDTYLTPLTISNIAAPAGREARPEKRQIAARQAETDAVLEAAK